ncbi:Hypothetical predicted protein [Lecanosticta acicola]|uniref:tRNA (guanine(9)-N1)-methyltransferase n=1 Tax=Lecanosticta acicola TaxID=111012 RepID=A0AAI8Z1G7_9PEZI|nr:Hypothetical predicted protein [Lecanosticta acicola]
MESEERPSKMRKLDDGSHHGEDASLRRTDQKEIDAETVIVQENGSLNPQNGEDTSHEDDEPDSDGHDENEELPAPVETAPAVGGINDISANPALSKNQLKKLRKKAEWEAKREDRKVIRKEKLQARRERKKAAKQEAEANPEAVTDTKKPTYRQPAVQLPVTIVIDCDFDNLMHDGERMSLGSQITRCYSDNKNALFRAHLTICSFGGKLRERFDGLLNATYKSWRGVRTFDEDFVETAEKAKEWMRSDQGGQLAGSFSKYANLDDDAQTKLKEEGEIVYLTSEADEDLTELKPYSTYIIGGLVDKNREKGICYKRATRRNVKTAKLPIGEYMDMSSRKVLTTNHVNEIMVKWLECGDWGDAFMKVIPKRKGGKLKAAGSMDESEDKFEGDEVDATRDHNHDKDVEPDDKERDEANGRQDNS